MRYATGCHRQFLKWQEDIWTEGKADLEPLWGDLLRTVASKLDFVPYALSRRPPMSG
jgi:hypothetical protein